MLKNRYPESNPISTFFKFNSSDTSLLSLIFHIFKHSPEVASRSGLSPF